MADNKITVDNYPIDYSVQYEKNRSDQDDNLLDDADKVRVSVSRDTFEPTDSSAVDEMFQQGSKSAPWGAIEGPPGTGGGRNLFKGGQLTTTFGPQERLDSMSVRIEGIKDEQVARIRNNPSTGDVSSKIKGVEKNANTISSLVDTISSINNTIEYVHGEIARFKKG